MQPPTNEQVEEAIGKLEPDDLVAKFVTDTGFELPEIPSHQILHVLDWNTMSDRLELKLFASNVHEVDGTSDNTKEFVAYMCNTMYANNGIGLAATQVAVPLRLFVMDCTQEHGFGKCPRVMINPALKSFEDKVDQTEGCLSVPALPVEVKRWNKVVVTCKDLEWQNREYTFEGMEAHAVQHEMDHLIGTTIIDSLPKLAQDMYGRKVQKIKRQAKAIAKDMQKRGAVPNA